jgi:nitrogen regulatory protein P-II 1
MKEIKAYVRRSEVDQVVQKLRNVGVPGVSIIHIHPLGYGYEPNPFEPHGAGFVDRYRYLTIVKLEIMCADAQVDTIVEAIQAHCRSGDCGDGMIFVSEVIDAVRIHDGQRGEAALGSPPRDSGARRWTVAV